MDNLSLHVLRQLQAWRAQGQAAMLATVVRTWGSSPRPVGSVMALRGDDGSVVGSVSGGCIEDDLIERYTRFHANPSATGTARKGAETARLCGLPETLVYGLSADEAHRFGLPCGGTLELLAEYDPDPQRLGELVAALDAGTLVRRILNLRDGSVQLQDGAATDGLMLSETQLCTTFGPGYRMLLIGAGALAEYLSSMAVSCGFAVTVCDPRTEYRGNWSGAPVQVVADMPDDAVAAFAPNRRSCIVALSHDPKLDDLALIDALQSQAFYVGAIGSRRNQAARRERLMLHFGLDAATMDRLHGPTGLHIGSKTPAEIAVSIMAEVLACKNGVALSRRAGSDMMAIETPVAATSGRSSGAAPSRVVAGSANG
ncbi:XdhC family protein [Comamonadaceae bacterium G21597-S1]|nr:XdhC family protein [Comamonadaceae bacterium G21597-S1]